MTKRMRRTERATGIFLGIIAGLGLATGASALSINSANSGLDQGVGCTSTSCLTVLYDLAASAPVTGTIDITGSTLNFSIQLASASMNATGAGDGAVTALSFSNVTYSGSVGVTLNGSSYNVNAAQVGAVSGTVTPTGAGSATSIAGTTVLVTGVCSGTPGSSLQCGLIFGPQSNFSAIVNGNTRFFRHTVDVFAAVPEPGTAILIGAGLFALGARRREAAE
jgi:hypothetical protein